jgi:hypothetical protein
MSSKMTVVNMKSFLKLYEWTQCAHLGTVEMEAFSYFVQNEKGK